MNSRATSKSLRLTVRYALVLLATVASWSLSAPLLAETTSSAKTSPWKLVWCDDFDKLDLERWEVLKSFKPTNNSLHAYLPEQVSIRDGHLVITTVRRDDEKLPFASGLVKSREFQKHGRWEVRAKLPTTRGIWPAIWLLPSTKKYPWPSGGEIDFMEHRGDQPTITSSAFHYGERDPFRHEFVSAEYEHTAAGKPADCTKDFHVYATEWEQKEVRLYVDGKRHATFNDKEVADFLSKRTGPMQLILNTAVGGDFLPNPDDTTVLPQEFLIDWVKVYRANPMAHAK